MRVSVVIVNWNGCHLLAECLQALKQQDHAIYELWVVDNGSDDGSLEFLNSYQWDLLKVISLPENKGFAGGNNVAISQAQGDIIALLNNDAMADPSWLSQAVKGFSNEQVGMVASRVVRYHERHIIDKVGHLMYPDGLNRGRGTGCPNDHRWDHDDETLWPDGCAALYRRSMLQEIGLLDEDFFLYGEDAELGMRARWAGYTCRYRSKAIVYHKHSASLGKFSPNKVFYVERNRIWLMFKTFPWSMILRSPWHTAIRHLLNVVSMMRGQGSAHGFRQSHSGWRLVWVFIKAHGSAFGGLVVMLGKRKQLLKRITSSEMQNILSRHRISAKKLVFED